MPYTFQRWLSNYQYLNAYDALKLTFTHGFCYTRRCAIRQFDSRTPLIWTIISNVFYFACMQFERIEIFC